MDEDAYDNDETNVKPIQNEEAIINEQNQQKAQDNTLSPSSSLTSGTDVYMDAVEILTDENQNDKSGREYFSTDKNCRLHTDASYLDGTVTPICYGTFSKEIIDTFSVNLHRIDKDVARCDRTYAYFTNLNNLKKLRNIMCT